jgi:hypothetical protein
MGKLIGFLLKELIGFLLSVLLAPLISGAGAIMLLLRLVGLLGM